MGKFLVLMLVLVAVAAIGGLLYRPGAVIGVSGKSLAHSVAGQADADENGTCVETGDDDNFICTVVDSDRKPSCHLHRGDEGRRMLGRHPASGAGDSQPEALSGCITIVDLVRAD